MWCLWKAMQWYYKSNAMVLMRKFCTRASNYKSTHNFQKELKLSNQAVTFSQTLSAE